MKRFADYEFHTSDGKTIKLSRELVIKWAQVYLGVLGLYEGDIKIKLETMLGLEDKMIQQSDKCPYCGKTGMGYRGHCSMGGCPMGADL